MSQSHALQNHIIQLKEIRSILNAMKNLALMEIHKLSGLQAMQSQALANIESAITDFLCFHPGLVTEQGESKHIAIVVGSERGFCGDFNESLINALKDENFTDVIAIGNRLINKAIDNNHALAAEISGVNIAEDVTSVIGELIESINNLIQEDKALTLIQSGIRLTVVYHDRETSRLNKRQLFPLAMRQPNNRQYSCPPLLNLEASDFYLKLIHHYLFTVFHVIFYDAFSAENHNRLQHLDAAVKHIDDNSVSLHRKLQTYRQEEITEEIEVILLNSEHMTD